ncbi:MAG: phosphohistidine phosphatase SixA [Chloroflexota bacterium]
MKIYLIRHSNAVDPGTPGYEDDSTRPLTEKGHDKMKTIASALKALNIKPDLIVSSPYVRARQTAEILAKVLKYKQELAFSDTLVPMGNADNIIGEINEKYSVDELVLVGHEPCLSGLIGALTAGNPDLAFNLKKGGVCCLSSDDLHTERKAVLEWLLTPKILTALA